VLENWVKTYHSRNVGATEFVNVFVNKSQGCCSVSWQKSTHEVVSLFLHDSLTHWCCVKQLPNWHQDRRSTSRFRTTGIWRIRGNREVEDFRDLEKILFGCGFWNSVRRSWWFATFANGGSKVRGGPGQRCCLKSPGSKRELVAGL
jgi:hypothetical protein